MSYQDLIANARRMANRTGADKHVAEAFLLLTDDFFASEGTEGVTWLLSDEGVNFLVLPMLGKNIRMQITLDPSKKDLAASMTTDTDRELRDFIHKKCRGWKCLSEGIDGLHVNKNEIIEPDDEILADLEDEDDNMDSPASDEMRTFLATIQRERGLVTLGEVATFMEGVTPSRMADVEIVARWAYDKDRDEVPFSEYIDHFDIKDFQSEFNHLATIYKPNTKITAILEG